MTKFLENMNVHFTTLVVVVLFVITNVVAIMTTYNSLSNKIDKLILTIDYKEQMTNTRFLAIEKQLWLNE